MKHGQFALPGRGTVCAMISTVSSLLLGLRSVHASACRYVLRFS